MKNGYRSNSDVASHVVSPTVRHKNTIIIYTLGFLLAVLTYQSSASVIIGYEVRQNTNNLIAANQAQRSNPVEAKTTNTASTHSTAPKTTPPQTTPKPSGAESTTNIPARTQPAQQTVRQKVSVIPFYLTTTPNSDELGYVSIDKISSIKQFGSWSKVTFRDGVPGWLHRSYLQPVTENRVRVVAKSGLRLRASPSATPSNILGVIPSGAEFGVYSLRDDWVEIRTPSDTGFWIKTQQYVQASGS